MFLGCVMYGEESDVKHLRGLVVSNVCFLLIRSFSNFHPSFLEI